MTDLYRRSIEIILANQHPSGAYVACPNFPTYRYCWFRDGSFVAYAMDLAGEHESAARFHAWAARAVLRREDVIRRGLDKAAQALPLDESDVLHTRLTLEGEDGTQEEWANFQLDGFGTWLWALEQHARLCGDPLPPEWLTAAGLTADYLSALWQRPCFDCWEEYPAQVHPHTLAAIYGGLKAYQNLAPGPDGVPLGPVLNAIRVYVEEAFVLDGHFVKFSGAPAVDASLLGLAVPYGLVAPDDPRMLATAAEIERTLLQGGVHRYATDTYYGGGAWILLTAWLGWYRAACGRPESAEAILKWIEAQADPQGNLPEQVPQALNDHAYYPQWVARWGPVASPLLWSHAKYIILKREGGT